jgi:2-oxo-4-hydroxy-4-carboxy-5-ureidoimidazoline decarboxylase
MNAESLNQMSPDAARGTLLRCCGSGRWADAMTLRRPFAAAGDVLRAAAEVEASLDRSDWLEAFAAHPRIGDLESLRKKFASTADLASGEQAGVAGADDEVIRALADGNGEYEARFGYIFIVCASGKSAAEMLAILRQRLKNDPATELQIAAAEQAKITRLRLEKL